MGVVKLAFLLILYTAIPVFILLCTPGLPPNMKFEGYNITPPIKLEGNNKLDRAELLSDDKLIGPESIAIRGDEVYTGVVGGDILRLKGNKWERVINTGKKCAGYWDESESCGRPLGLRFDASGKLLVADSNQGLLRVDLDKKTVEKIVGRGVKLAGIENGINFVDDVDISKDGVIYFSDAGFHATMLSHLMDLIGEPTGRLIKFDEKRKKGEVLISGVRFANGVQLSKNQDFVALCETGMARVLKYYISGPKTGKTEVLIDGLPGFPDNIRSNGKGGFYIALVTSRSIENPGVIDQYAGIPWARKLLIRFTTVLVNGLNFVNYYANNHELISKAIAYVKHFGPLGEISMFPANVIIVEVDENGEILGNLQNRDSKIAFISDVGVGEKYAYFGSPFTNQAWRIKREYL